MLNSKIKLLAIVSLSCSTITYGATQHLFQVDIEQNLKNSAIVAFNYDTTTEQGPGAVVFTRREDGASTRWFGMDVYGETIRLTQAVVQYEFQEYEKYKLNQSCENIKLQPHNDSRGVLVTLHVNQTSKSIDCSSISMH